MIIGIARLEFAIPGARSLKEKRRFLNAFKSSVARAFNVSVAEVDAHDVWQQSVVAVVHVGVTKPVVESLLARIVAWAEDFSGMQLLTSETELIQ